MVVLKLQGVGDAEEEAEGCVNSRGGSRDGVVGDGRVRGLARLQRCIAPSSGRKRPMWRAWNDAACRE